MPDVFNYRPVCECYWPDTTAEQAYRVLPGSHKGVGSIGSVRWSKRHLLDLWRFAAHRAADGHFDVYVEPAPTPEESWRMTALQAANFRPYRGKGYGTYPALAAVERESDHG
jgi:hypothetical protein